MSALKLYNSLKRTKEDFVPINPDHVRIYACGPTVYSYAHIGNARMAVVFDLLARLLRQQFPQVTYVSNITDVEDKIIAASQETGEPIDTLTRKFEAIYNADMAALGVEPPDVQPRVTEHIPEIIALNEALIERGHAYAAEGHVLFNVPSFEAYGGLSGRSRDDQIAGARVEIAPYKKDAADFILWKPSTPDQPGWDSPHGRGRPGWHSECSAMAEKHLGLPFDIHGGGADLKFPHHENEIAVSCCAHGHETDLSAFAKTWVHNGFVTVAGEKMSKSIGNVVLAHDLINKGIKGEVIRFALLSGHYRQPLDWTDDGIAQAKRTLDRYYQILLQLQDIGLEAVEIPSGILGALNDDLNTPKAFAELNALAKEAADKKTPRAKTSLLAAGALMGFLLEDPAAWLGYGETENMSDSQNAGSANDNAAEIDALVAERTAAKKEKNFARADAIRDELLARKIIVEDFPDGSKWRKA